MTTVKTDVVKATPPDPGTIQISRLPSSAIHLRRYRHTITRVTTYPRARYTGSAPTATYVLVHGLGVSSDYFHRLIDELRSSGHVITIDLPGFGGTPAPRKQLTIEDYAQIVADAITEFANQPVTLTGHSMGAQVALELAATRPELLYSLVLVGIPEPLSHPQLPRVGLRFAASTVHEPAGLTWLAFLSYMKCGVVTFARAVIPVVKYRAENALQRVDPRIPVRFVRGEYDYVSPTSWLTRASRILRGNGSTVASSFAPDGAHSVLFDNDEWLATLLVDAAHAHSTRLRTRLRRGEGDEDVWEEGFHHAPSDDNNWRQHLRPLRTDFTKISRAVLTEITRDLLDTAHTLRHRQPPAEWKEGTKIPVVALPGINESWISMQPLLQALNDAGHPIITVPKLGRSVPEPDELVPYLEDATDSAGADQYAIVAHSKGGLVARAALRSPSGQQKVARVVTIGTPYAGTPWGRIFPRSTQIGRLRPDGPFFTTEYGPGFPYDRFVVVSSRFDHKVLSRSFLNDAATHHTVSTYGHTLPMRDPETISLIKDALADL